MKTAILVLSVFLGISQSSAEAAPKTRQDLYELCTQKKASEACLSLAEVVWQDKTPASRKIGMEYLKYACSLKNGAACDLAKNTTVDSDWMTVKGKRITASSKSGAKKMKKAKAAKRQ